jgi:hypothetical protein
MFIDWSAVQVQQARYEDFLRQAERERLIRQVRTGQTRRNRFYGGGLIWLGRRLVAWGWRLQEHCGATAEASTFQLAHHPR